MTLGGFFLLIVAPMLLGCAIIGIQEEIRDYIKNRR